MRRYLELIELATAEETDFIRIDITEWSKEDVDEAIALLRQHASESYSSYVLQLHYCYHEEEKECRVEVVEAK